MRIAIFSTNLSFFDMFSNAIKNRGWELCFWTKSSEFINGCQIERLLNWCDVAFIESCQEPIVEVLNIAKDHNKIIIARLHQTDIYNKTITDKYINWSSIDILFAPSRHIVNKFMAKRINMSKPSSIVVMPINIVDSIKFKFIEREWIPPFRLCMIGPITPQKRQYTTIEYFYDMRNKFGNKFILDIVDSNNQHNNTEYLESCLDLINDLDLSDIVTIYNYIDHNHIVEFMQREHIIISNSSEEDTHMSIVEGTMTGCIPFIHAWCGATTIYPMAWHFKSNNEFINLCDKVNRSSPENLIKISRQMSNDVTKIYGDVSNYDKILDYIEAAIKHRKIL